ncbi:MAG: hypothetical protein O8C64_10170 [Candidatus Methanoperedens sp.]|nr:hypothetical protein [Candidatus Methanoperedens sp.]MCZ7406272.1 hypothetical protein [Candidatus Methanoperedens sp.]
MLSSTIVSSSAGIISFTSTISAPQLGVLGVVALIILLSLKEILSASKSWNKNLACSLDMSILPLLIAFFAIVFFKVTEILK